MSAAGLKTVFCFLDPGRKQRITFSDFYRLLRVARSTSLALPGMRTGEASMEALASKAELRGEGGHSNDATADESETEVEMPADVERAARMIVGSVIDLLASADGARLCGSLDKMDNARTGAPL